MSSFIKIILKSEDTFVRGCNWNIVYNSLGLFKEEPHTSVGRSSIKMERKEERNHFPGNGQSKLVYISHEVS